MTTQILEGTWEEIARQSKKLVGRKVRVLVLEDDVPAEPNRKALEILKEIRSRQNGLRFTAGEKATEIIRRGRAGEMFESGIE